MFLFDIWICLFGNPYESENKAFDGLTHQSNIKDINIRHPMNINLFEYTSNTKMDIQLVFSSCCGFIVPECRNILVLGQRYRWHVSLKAAVLCFEFLTSGLLAIYQRCNYYVLIYPLNFEVTHNLSTALKPTILYFLCIYLLLWVMKSAIYHSIENCFILFTRSIVRRYGQCIKFCLGAIIEFTYIFDFWTFC